MLRSSYDWLTAGTDQHSIQYKPIIRPFIPWRQTLKFLSYRGHQPLLLVGTVDMHVKCYTICAWLHASRSMPCISSVTQHVEFLVTVYSISARWWWWCDTDYLYYSLLFIFKKKNARFTQALSLFFLFLICISCHISSYWWIYGRVFVFSKSRHTHTLTITIYPYSNPNHKQPKLSNHALTKLGIDTNNIGVTDSYRNIGMRLKMICL